MIHENIREFNITDYSADMMQQLSDNNNYKLEVYSIDRFGM